MKRILNILEYINNPLIWFKRYLTMSDREKIDDLIESRPELYGYYADNEAEDAPLELPDDFDADDDYDYVMSLPEDERQAYGEWLLNNALSSGDTDAPAWVHMHYEGIVKNQWLLHMTNNVPDIISEGFSNGLEDYTQLAYTRHGSHEKGYDRDFIYTFAYTLNDFKKYARHDRYGKGYKYGEDAIMFKASGVRIYHDGDEEYQTIFMASSARDIIPILHGGEEKEYYIEIESRDTYKLPTRIDFDTIEEASEWVVNNFEQYKNRIVQRDKN